MTMYPEANYSLYKFARTRHGFWFWFIHLLAIGGHPYTLLVGDWHWSWIVVTVVVEFVYWRVIVWTHRNRLRKMNEKGPNNPLNHHKELWDGADYVCMHGLKPSKRTHKCAWPIAHDLNKFPDEPSADERAIQCDL